jgi:hypothetical protein
VRKYNNILYEGEREKSAQVCLRTCSSLSLSLSLARERERERKKERKKERERERREREKREGEREKSAQVCERKKTHTNCSSSEAPSSRFALVIPVEFTYIQCVRHSMSGHTFNAFDIQ